MNERSGKLTRQKAIDDATMNFVSRQAQEAILNPNLPELYKDYVLEAAVETLRGIEERKEVYSTNWIDNQELKQSRTIYEAGGEEGKKREETPPIIVELNEHLKITASHDLEDFTVERIAQRVGIHKSILYEWVKSDPEFAKTLERLKDVQQNDPFKTGTDEDTFVNSVLIALTLLETRDRHYKSQNQ
jgi:hypothetical protein